MPEQPATTPRRWRKKPVVIEAMQFDGSRMSVETCCRWVNDGTEEPILDYIFTGSDDVRDVRIATLEGPLNVSPGDWIHPGRSGRVLSVQAGPIFEATYEPA